MSLPSRKAQSSPGSNAVHPGLARLRIRCLGSGCFLDPLLGRHADLNVRVVAIDGYPERVFLVESQIRLPHLPLHSKLSALSENNQ